MAEPLGLTDKQAAEAAAEPDCSTKDFCLQHISYRIKDPKASIDFYTRILGMRFMKKCDFPSKKFSVYLLGFCEAGNVPQDEKEKTAWAFSQKAALELNHQWGSENEACVQYHNGNTDPRGYGHIALKVPDVDKACERLEQLGVSFVKRPNDGEMKGLAFIKDPDGYWIEILSPENMTRILH